jgi:hypothetical protein
MGTVKSRIVRGREALRRYLANRINPAGSLEIAGPAASNDMTWGLVK